MNALKGIYGQHIECDMRSLVLANSFECMAFLLRASVLYGRAIGVRVTCEKIHRTLGTCAVSRDTWTVQPREPASGRHLLLEILRLACRPTPTAERRHNEEICVAIWFSASWLLLLYFDCLMRLGGFARVHEAVRREKVIAKTKRACAATTNFSLRSNLAVSF